MDITEVRIKLVTANNDKLRAFCSITIDHDFVVRDLKIIEGAKGPFVAMPSRKLTLRCSRCGTKNPHRARYCNECGGRLPQRKQVLDPENRQKLHADIAHPINSRCREMIQRQVLDEYESELERAKAPGYQPAEIDTFDDDGDYFDVEGPGSRAAPADERWPPARHGSEPDKVPGMRPGSDRLEKGGRLEESRGPWGLERSDWRSEETPSPQRTVPSGLSGRSASERGDPAERRPRIEGDEEAGREREGPERDASERGGYFARDKIPSRRAPADETDGEPEDNFGEGLFS